MITLGQYFMGRDQVYGHLLTNELKSNALDVVEKVNQLLLAFGESRKVNSGWRPPAVNAGTVGAATKSKHMACQACDLEDSDGDLDEWCMEHLDTLSQIGLWMEHPASTKGWCHVQTISPKSGKRVFYP